MSLSGSRANSGLTAGMLAGICLECRWCRRRLRVDLGQPGPTLNPPREEDRDMLTSLRYTFRFALAVAVFASLSLLPRTHTSINDLYLGALDNLGASAAFAAPTCENKHCTHSQSGKAQCTPNPGTNCIKRNGGALCGGSAC
jgi:hypothetical protein